MKKFLSLLVLVTLLSFSEQTSNFSDNGVNASAVTTGDGQVVAGVSNSTGFPSTGNSNSSANAPSGYDCVPGIGCYKLVKHGLQFNEAKLACEESGGYLAIMNSQAEAFAVADFIRPVPERGQLWPRLGFGDFFEKGVFRTIFDQDLNSTGYEVWYPGQPDLQYDRNCGCINIEGKLGTECCDCNAWYFCELNSD